MATAGHSSRRNFVVGGAAAAVFMGPLAAAQLARQADSPLRLDPAALRGEVGEWEGLVGASFLIAGEGGKAVARLAAIERAPADPLRPASLARHQPFTAYFELDPRRAPAGQKTYSVTHPGRGAMDLFLSRGVDTRGKAVALALFN